MNFLSQNICIQFVASSSQIMTLNKIIINAQVPLQLIYLDNATSKLKQIENALVREQAHKL